MPKGQNSTNCVCWWPHPNPPNLRLPWILLKHLIPIFSASVFGCRDSPSGHWELHFVGRAFHPCHLHLHRGPATRRSCSRPRCIRGVVEPWSVMVSLPIFFLESCNMSRISAVVWTWLILAAHPYCLLVWKPICSSQSQPIKNIEIKIPISKPVTAGLLLMASDSPKNNKGEGKGQNMKTT